MWLKCHTLTITNVKWDSLFVGNNSETGSVWQGIPQAPLHRGKKETEEYYALCIKASINNAMKTQRS